MDYQQLMALAIFAFTTTVTPGPNNIMLMASGANIGFKRTLPHMLGIITGFSFMVSIVGTGLSGIFATYPQLYTALHIISVGYLLYLAMKIATSPAGLHGEGNYQPMSFYSAVLFQWVNPKGWTMAISTISLFNANGDFHIVLLIAAIFALVNVPSVTLWTYAGKQMQSILANQTKSKYFNITMALLLLASLYPILFS